MKKTALMTAVWLAAALFLALGSSWAEEARKSDESRMADEIARRLAERLAGEEPGQAPGLLLRAQLPQAPPWPNSMPPVTPCLAQSGPSEADPCAVARALSRMRPCLDIGNCPAVGAWRRIYGLEEPRIVPAEPAPPSVPALASTREEE